MYKYSGGGVGADIGLSREFKGPPVKGNRSSINAGLSVLNALRPKVKLIDTETLNAVYKAAIVYSMPVVYRMTSRDIVSIYLDMNLQENMAYPAFGAEYCYAQKYTLRSGYYRERPTAGAGFKINNMRVDYAIDFGPVEYL